VSGGRASRGRWAVVVLLLAAGVGASSLVPWVRASGVSALAGYVAVRLSGSAAAPAVPATALVLAAAGAAVALAGRLGRWVVAAVVVIGGVAVAAAAVAVLANPGATAAGAVAAQTGVDHLTGPATATAGPWVAIVIGILAVLAGIGLARASAAWDAPSRRHEVVRRPAPDEGTPDERADWDALTRGADPSDGPDERGRLG
jgi:uncharacterized membrane protein (TIGR02234 family)